MRKLKVSKERTPRVPIRKFPGSAQLRIASKILKPVAGILAKAIPPYFKNSWRELRQTVWPNRRESWRLTSAVFIFAILFGLAIYGVDRGLDEIFKKVVLK